MARLVVISNRVAVPDRATRAGGLAVALKAALKRNHGLWFGWSGKVVASPGAAEASEHDGISYVTIDLAKADHEEFYNGFANGVLWPILHYRLDLIEFTRRDFGGYLRVNDYFARHLETLLKPDDVIWVHDYHFIPLARMLRERGHKNRIGFFLHIPFPTPEVLTALPNHDKLIPSLCHYDLVGFQTDVDAANFSRYLAQECGLAWASGNSFHFHDRVVEFGAFPIGIETETFAKIARRAVHTKFVKDVVSSLGGRAMLIGADRLDYSKGLPLRMEAFDRFLANFPDWRGKCTYLQITPTSRGDIEQYAEIARRVGEAAGRINGTYGEANWTPIRYINKAHSRTALAGLYREARACLVTPLRDGMNLVAKEFIAAQNADDPGVLVLSRFAGAARELKSAMLVNPYDPEGVAQSINRALSMPLDERRQRQAELFKVVLDNDISHWSDRYLDVLRKPATQVELPPRFRVVN
ncbi:MAG: alpha,alpha-trehalose-phosphate synthase (UDP-forming) [Pseudolabrys sp.]|nr:alpha,alpha-trehalose-phosphate synthase (UDP-forming) [Pseudolabrys sp.]